MYASDNPDSRANGRMYEAIIRDVAAIVIHDNARFAAPTLFALLALLAIKLCLPDGRRFGS